MKKANEISLDTLRQCVRIGDDSASLIWLKQCARKVRVGSRAGTLCHGREFITINRVKMGVSRVIYALRHGMWPRGQVDHIDGNPLNNHIDNLRDVPVRVNAQNVRRARAHNTTGVLGVRRHGSGYSARVIHQGKEHYAGSFKTVEEASAAYVKLKRALHEGCTL